MESLLRVWSSSSNWPFAMNNGTCCWPWWNLPLLYSKYVFHIPIFGRNIASLLVFVEWSGPRRAVHQRSPVSQSDSRLGAAAPECPKTPPLPAAAEREPSHVWARRRRHAFHLSTQQTRSLPLRLESKSGFVHVLFLAAATKKPETIEDLLEFSAILLGSLNHPKVSIQVYTEKNDCRNNSHVFVTSEFICNFRNNLFPGNGRHRYYSRLLSVSLEQMPGGLFQNPNRIHRCQHLHQSSSEDWTATESKSRFVHLTRKTIWRGKLGFRCCNWCVRCSVLCAGWVWVWLTPWPWETSPFELRMPWSWLRADLTVNWFLFVSNYSCDNKTWKI